MKAYEELLGRMKEIDLIGQIGSLLSWDQEVMMPTKAAKIRAEQLAWISKTGHEKITNPRIDVILKELEEFSDLNEIQIANIRLVRESYDRSTKLPTEFVEEMAKHRSKSVISWTEAREKDDFEIFKPDLELAIEYARRKADFLGFEEERYDALLDLYETGLTISKLDPLFNGLKDNISPILNSVTNLKKRNELEWFEKDDWDLQGQEKLSQIVSEAIGFDFSSGRRDSSTHPFCGGPNPDDVRWTTRYSRTDPFGSLFGSMHETGHGTYEQGRPRSLDFQLAGKANGLGIHESQSRLWENQVGRSLEFCIWSLPHWKECFPDNMKDKDEGDLWEAVNSVKPGLIRVDADEVTYNLHIIIRYEIEKLLISGDIGVDELPNIWDDMYEKYLGISPPNYSLGVLQDIHWSMGAFGYFPTYTLGNLYASQLLDAAKNDLPDYNKSISEGRFGDLLGWMRNKIHLRGSILKPDELIEEATGIPPSPDSFVNYISQKVNGLYGI